jgi:acetyl-CoA synthetase
MPDQHAEFDDLLKEGRTFPPPPAFKTQAVAADEGVYAEAARDPEAFWARQAGELEWSRPWTTVLDWQPPHAKWFVGGQLNASVNCIDRHVRGARRNKAAIIWEGEPGDRRTLTYFDLHREVSTFANVLKSLGARKGDRIAIYMPLVPELAIAMLACARIGAVHSVVFRSSAPSLYAIGSATHRRRGAHHGRWQLSPRNIVAPRRSRTRLAGTPSIEHVVMLKGRPSRSGSS